jgi:hypothetical protein
MPGDQDFTPSDLTDTPRETNADAKAKDRKGADDRYQAGNGILHFWLSVTQSDYHHNLS